MRLSKIIGLVLSIFIVRISSFYISLPKNFDNIWRPGNFKDMPASVYCITAIISAIAGYIFLNGLRESDDGVKKSFFHYFAISFVSVSLFKRTFVQTNITYLVLIFASRLKLSDYLSDLILDCFFEPPYIVLSLIAMYFIYYICKRHKHIEHSIPFWIIPFYFIGFHKFDLSILLILIYATITIIGFRFLNPKTPVILLIFQFLTILFSILYFDYYKQTHVNYIKLALITMLIFYIPSFILAFSLSAQSNRTAKNLLWIIPLTTTYNLLLPISRLTSSYNLIFFFSIQNLFLVLGNSILIVCFIGLITTLVGKVFKKLESAVFTFLSIIAISFYILDAGLFYYTHNRLNYQTIAWALSMDNIKQTTLATIAEYLSPKSIAIILSILVVTIIAYFQSKRLFSKGLPKSLLFSAIIVSHLSSAILQLTEPLPQILRDPFFELIKSIPASNYFLKSIPIRVIEEEFKHLGIELTKHENQKLFNDTHKTNIILITLESTHWLYINMFGEEPKTWPLMGSLKNRMEIFPFIFSCYPESTCGDYAMITSLVPYDHHFLSQNTDMNHIGLINELKKYNYNTYLFSSGSISDGGLINVTKQLHFDYSFTYNSSEVKNKLNTWSWGYREDYMSDQIIEYLKQRNKSKPYFVWYRMVYPHAPFPALEADSIKKQMEEADKLTIVEKYKDSLLFTDKVLYNFVNEITELDKITNQKTLIVMVGDHGEMLGEKHNQGLISHGSYTTAMLQNVVCIFIKPDEEGLKVNKNPGSQIDITPTIMDYLNLKPSVARYEQGKSLYSNSIATRPVYLSSSLSYALISDGYFFEFRDKNSPNAIIKKLIFSEKNKKAEYEPINSWKNHEDLYEKYKRTERFFKLQKMFLKQL